MKIFINKWTISILAIGLLASGCASNSNDTPIYYHAHKPNSKPYEPMPFYPQDDYKSRLQDDDVSADEGCAIAKLDYIQQEDSLIVGKPYKVKGRTFVPKHQPKYRAVGMASWSGKKHQGNSTAIGEPFDRYSRTAAHPTLPLNAVVEVTNLINGRSQLLRINDRGPFSSNRIINVTEGAARDLAFLNSGLAKVRVEYMGAAPVPEAAMKLKADRC